MSLLEQPGDLFARVRTIVTDARARVARTVNSAMVRAYWRVGREILEEEQRGASRAEYGEHLIERLSERLTAEFGKGFSVANLRRMRQFYRVFPAGSALSASGPEDVKIKRETGAKAIQSTASSELATRIQSTASSELEPDDWSPFPAQLSWSHYVALMRVENDRARQFYEIEAERERWSVRQLERQTASLLYERLAKSRDPEGVLALARDGNELTRPRDLIKDPFVLEFLDLEERHHWLEHDLESAIMDQLERFMLELGKGFCFVGRQCRLTLEGDHFYVDLVFYNRLLRCFVLLDLKLGKLAHGDLGQMQMYVHYYDRFKREEWEAPTVGIVLCSDKNDAMVQITLPEEDEQIHASRYQLYLPTEEQLRRELVSHRATLERVP